MVNWSKAKEGIKKGAKAGVSSAKKAAKKGYDIGQRIEFAPEDRIQRGEVLFGLRKSVTAKPSKKKKRMVKVKQDKKGSIPPKRKPSRKPIVSAPRPIKDTGKYVIVKKQINPTVKKFSVQFRRSSSGKYNREWFANYNDAVAFARSISKEYGVKVTYE